MEEKKRTFTEWLFTFLLEHKDIEVIMERYMLYDEPGIAIILVDHDDNIHTARKIREIVRPQYVPTKMTIDDFMIFSTTNLYEKLKSNE